MGRREPKPDQSVSGQGFLGKGTPLTLAAGHSRLYGAPWPGMGVSPMETESHEGDAAVRRFLLRPNCGVYWQTTVIVFVAIAAVSLTIATLFAFAGFWPILPFAGLELTALGVALYVSAVRGNYREEIRVDSSTVEIRKGRKEPDRVWNFDLAWSEVLLEASFHRWYPSRLAIRSQGNAVELGAFLTEEERLSLAEELRRCIGPMAARGIPPGGAAAVGNRTS